MRGVERKALALQVDCVKQAEVILRVAISL
jgi:hypothetical protein